MERERNAWGRPQNARPRDRTGQPLPRGSTRTDLAEDHPVTTVEQALVHAQRLWDAQRYFEAHELLEHVWHESAGDDRAFWQGVIQFAVAFVHLQRGRPAGTIRSLVKCLDNLAACPADHHGIDVARIRSLATATHDLLVVEPASTIAPPGLPVTDGPWFTRDGGPHPLPEDPSWLVAARRRQQERR